MLHGSESLDADNNITYTVFDAPPRGTHANISVYLYFYNFRHIFAICWDIFTIIFEHFVLE